MGMAKGKIKSIGEVRNLAAELGFDHLEIYGQGKNAGGIRFFSIVQEEARLDTRPIRSTRGGFWVTLTDFGKPRPKKWRTDKEDLKDRVPDFLADFLRELFQAEGESLENSVSLALGQGPELDDE